MRPSISKPSLQLILSIVILALPQYFVLYRVCSLDQVDEPACQGGLEEGLEMCRRKGLCTRFLETWLICIVLDLGDDPGRYGDNRTII